MEVIQTNWRRQNQRIEEALESRVVNSFPFQSCFKTIVCSIFSVSLDPDFWLSWPWLMPNLPSPWISGLRRWAFPFHLLIIASVSSMFPFHNAARWRPYPLKLFHRVAGQQFQTSGGTCSSRSFSGSRASDLPWGYPLLPYFTDLLRSVIILSDWNSTNSHV